MNIEISRQFAQERVQDFIRRAELERQVRDAKPPKALRLPTFLFRLPRLHKQHA
jgi:hypothetical protein